MSVVQPAIPRSVAARVRWGISDTWAITRRDLIQWVAEPWRIFAEILFPVMFVLLFGYVFGSGMVVPGGGDYREFLMPGLFVMTMAFGIGNTMTVVATDVERGVMDRFRSMPMSSFAVVAGRCTADMLNSAAGLAITIACGLVVGWSWHDGLWGAAAAVALLLLLRFACLWIGIWLGLMVGSPEAAGAVWGLLFPLTMITSAFVAPELMPGWLGTVAEWNPLSSTVTACRELFGNVGADGGGSWIASHAVLMAVVWPVVLVAVFFPLSVRRFQRLSR
jgi:ABC-type multidrug transport system permease subunit